MFFSLLMVNLPTLIVCVIALAVILVNWKRAPRAAVWAAMGFGLTLVICLAMPALHALLQRWVFQGSDQAGRVWTFTALSLAWSALHAGSYALLLVAVFSGRPKPEAAPAPPTTAP